MRTLSSKLKGELKMEKKDIKIIMLSVAVFAIAVCVSVFLARIAFWLCYQPAGEEEPFEDHLWTAKELVAEEIGYDGMLDAEHFQIYSDCRYVIMEDSTIIEVGQFQGEEAIKELNAALNYGDHHKDVTERIGDAIDIPMMYFVSWVVSIAVFVASMVAILYVVYRIYTHVVHA